MVEAPAKDKIMVDYMQKAADLIDKEPVRESDWTREGIMKRVLATTLEALDKAKAEAEDMRATSIKNARERNKAEACIDGMRGLAQEALHEAQNGSMARAVNILRTLIQPEPDPLVQEARNILANMPGLDALQARAYRDGDWDAGGSVDIALAAIKRGMELARHGLAVKEVG